MQKNNNGRYANKEADYGKEGGSGSRFTVISNHNTSLDNAIDIEIVRQNKKVGPSRDGKDMKENKSGAGGSVRNVSGNGLANIKNGKSIMSHKVTLKISVGQKNNANVKDLIFKDDQPKHVMVRNVNGEKNPQGTCGKEVNKRGKVLGKKNMNSKIKYKEKVGAEIVAQVNAKKTFEGDKGKNKISKPLLLVKRNGETSGSLDNELPIIQVHVDEEAIGYVTQRRKMENKVDANDLCY